MTDIQILQGTDSGYEWPVLGPDGEPMDLTSYTARAQIRTMDGAIVLHSFTTANSNIFLTTGSVMLTWTSSESASWRWRSGKYDLELVSPLNKVVRIDSGYVEVVPETTR